LGSNPPQNINFGGVLFMEGHPEESHRPGDKTEIKNSRPLKK